MSTPTAKPGVYLRVETALTWLLLGLVIVINVLVALRESRIETLTTEMMEDERVKALSDAWARCQTGYQTSPHFAKACADAEKATADKQHDIIVNGMRPYILQRFPSLAEFFILLRQASPEAANRHLTAESELSVARRLARMELRMAGLNRGAYNLPLLFFTFAYLGGLSLVFPQLEYFGSIPPSTSTSISRNRSVFP